ncbi:uncharacterized protein [Nicotiana tomentosiformis]|uniref:uncharacterized protein n=1 Tax=Nicotiana tomentosiformis TaxID=4098 RepID=UPI00388C891E
MSKREKLSSMCSWIVKLQYICGNSLRGTLGIQYRNETVNDKLSRWWGTNSKNVVHKLVLQITPIVICWELWRQRCSCKYGGQKKIWHRRMEHQIWWTVQLATSLTFPNCSLGNTWGELCDIVERLRPTPKWKIVKWIKLPNGIVKINTDGSFVREKAGIGGIVRNEQGKMIMAFSMPISCSSNNQEEAVATKFGIQWCLQNGFQECILEIDSLIITDMRKMRSTRNLKLKAVIDDIS